MSTGLLPGRITPLDDGGENCLVVAEGLTSAAAQRVPLRRGDGGRPHVSCGVNDKRNLGFASELVVQLGRQLGRDS